jgi:cobalt-zinc-cadmium efflux system outer membrane protein
VSVPPLCVRLRHLVVAIIGAGLTVVLASCVHYEALPLVPANSASSYSKRSLDSDSLRDAVVPLLGAGSRAWPPKEWDRASLLAVAITQNPELAVLRANIEVTLAEQERARELPNPDMTLQSEYSRGEQYTWLYGVGFDFLLLSPTQRRLNLNIARRASATAQWQLIEKTWQIRRAMIVALSDWEAAHRREPLLTQLIAAQQRLVELQQRRVEAGEDPPSELAVSRVGLLQVEQQRAEARAQTNNAQSALAAAMGMPPEALDSLVIEWRDWGEPPPLDQGELPALREKALLGRADLAAAINDYADSEDRLQLAIARQYPQFHLSPGYYWDHGVSKWPVDLGFALPIFNRNRGEIAEAHAERELSGQRMVAVQADIYGAITGAVRADALTSETVTSSDHQRLLADEQSHRSELGLKAGAIDSSERVAAEVVALRAALEDLIARSERQAARDELEDALHMPLSGPEKVLGNALISSNVAATSNPQDSAHP